MESNSSKSWVKHSIVSCHKQHASEQTASDSNLPLRQILFSEALPLLLRSARFLQPRSALQGLRA